MQDNLYIFIDNSFLFIQGYKFVKSEIGKNNQKQPVLNYKKLKDCFCKYGNVKQIVLVGSNLSGTIINNCQILNFDVYTYSKSTYKIDGKFISKEKGVDLKLAWELSKVIFTNKDTTKNKKIILCTGDRDFLPVLSDIKTAGWELEVWTWGNSYSKEYTEKVSAHGVIKNLDNDWKQIFDLKDKKGKQKNKI